MRKEPKQKKSKEHTKSLKVLKKKIGTILDRGYTAIRFKEEGIKQIRERKDKRLNSNALARSLVKDMKSTLRVIPKNKRLYKIHYTKKKLVPVREESKNPKRIERNKIYHALRQKYKIKDRYKDLKSVNYVTKRKRITEKDLHIDRIRELRKTLKSHRKELSTKLYRELYMKIKGGFFKGSIKTACTSLINQINIKKLKDENL